MQDHTLRGLITEARGRDEETDLVGRDNWMKSVLSWDIIREYERIESLSVERADRICAKTLYNDDWLSRLVAGCGTYTHVENRTEFGIDFTASEFEMTPDQFCTHTLRQMGIKDIEKNITGYTIGYLETKKTFFPEIILARGDIYNFDPARTSLVGTARNMRDRLRELRPLRKDDPVSVVWKEWTVGPRFYSKCHVDQGAGKLITSSADCCLISQTGKSFDKP